MIPLRCLPVVIGAAGLLPPAARADPSPDPLTPIRREMLAEYRYTPAGSPLADLPNSLQSNAPAMPAGSAGDPEIQRMDRYVVLESRDAVWPHKIPAPSTAPAAPPTVASRLGIGVHRAVVGKVEFFAATVFYVPVVVGFAW